MTLVSLGAAHEPDWVREVLSFWFLELGPAQWFGKDAQVDARIRTRFAALHGQLLATQAAGAQSLAARQAAIIVAPVASPSSTRTTVAPSALARGSPWCSSASNARAAATA